MAVQVVVTSQVRARRQTAPLLSSPWRYFLRALGYVPQRSWCSPGGCELRGDECPWGANSEAPRADLWGTPNGQADTQSLRGYDPR